MMTIICKSPPPISPSWELPDGWLLFYWGDALDQLAQGEGGLSQVVVSLTHQKALRFGGKLRQWLREEQVTGADADRHFIALHAQYQRGSFTVTERPQLATLTLAKLNTQRVLRSEGIEEAPPGPLRCLHVCPTQHEPQVLCASQLALSASPSVQLSASHPLWLDVMRAELALLCPWLSLDHPPLITADPQEALKERAHIELLISRDERGLSLYSRSLGSALILHGALQEAEWGRWLTGHERRAGLPLTMLNSALSTELLYDAESLLDGPTSESAIHLPVIRDSLYTMNYEDAPSEYPSEELADDLMEDPTSTLMNEEEEREEVVEERSRAEAPPPPHGEEQDADEAQDEDESSIFTDISLSDVSLSLPLSTDVEHKEGAIEPEHKLHEQLKRSPPIKLSPSASFDLDVLNLSESENNLSPRSHHALPTLKALEEDEGGLNTFNELKGSPDTVYQATREEPESSAVELSDSGAEVGSTPTRIDLDRYMVEEALAQLDDDSPTTTEAPPEVTPPSQRFMQTSDYHSQVPSSGREAPSFHGSIHEETTKVNDKDDPQPPPPDEEPTRKINLNAITTAEGEERRRSFSDVMRRFKPKP